MQRFNEFQKLLRRWPANYTPRVSTCRIEYEACLAQGITEAEIIDGTKYWLENCVPMDTSDYKPLSAHNWLREQSFLAYQPEEKRPRLEVV